MSRIPPTPAQAPDRSAPLEAEDTQAGVQTLVPGVVPVTLGDRLAVMANAPLLPNRAQRAADHGLFDTNASNQLEMF